MPETAIAPGTVLTDPEMEATHYDIPVVCFGEDGDMLALGHHEPRRALAAFNRHARTFIGLSNVADEPGALAQDWLDAIREGWVVFATPDPEQGDDPDYVWYAHPAKPDAPNAQPVTFLNA